MIVVRGGKKVRLDAASVLGVGGEATVLALDATAVAKVWHAPTPAHARKIHTILARRGFPPEVAAPVEALLDESASQVVGCVMPRVGDDFAPLATLLRKTPRPPVARIAAIFAALARVVAGLHAAGIVVGDLSDQNTLVSTSEVRLIDADSFQLDGEPCAVATEAYLDPSLYGVDLARAPAFRPAHDRYALAVLLFRALLALHPYGGVHPGLPTLAARASTRVWAFDPSVRYPHKVALAREVLSDDLDAFFARTFVDGLREELPLGALARHAATVARCAACGTEAPRARATCPSCAATSPRPPLHGTGTRVDPLFTARGAIVHVDVLDDLVHVFAEEDGMLVSYVLGRGAASPIVLGEAGPGARAFALEGGALVHARGENVLVHHPGGARASTTTTLFGGVPVVARAGGELVRQSGAFLVRARPFRGTFVERPLAHVLAGQTQVVTGASAVLGYHRLFSRVAGFRLDPRGRTDFALPALDPGEALRELALHDDGERTVVLRATTRGGVATTRVDLFAASGSLAGSSVVPAEAHPTRAGVRGRVLRRTALFHPTDDGVARETLEHDHVGDVAVIAGTASFCAESSLLFAHPRGVLVASERALVLVSRRP